jgi:tRNA 2-thiouridine synthesizing protein C
MKSFLFVNTCSPHLSINAQEGLDALLMGSAFTQCSALFVGEGVLQLIKGQNTEALKQKNFSLSFGALKDYGVENVYCSDSQLLRYGLSTSDLLIEVTALSDKDVAVLMADHDVILNF